MLKLFIFFSALALLFTPAQIKDIKENTMFYAYKDGYQIEITDERQDKVESLLRESLKGARKMPAFGVSLHDETVSAVNSGIWLRFKFSKKYEVDGMPFDEILVQVQKDMYGTNLIRGNDGRYEGRCFYLDLKNNCDKLFEYLSSLPVMEQKFEGTALDSAEGNSTDVLLQVLQDEDDMFSNRGKHALPLVRPQNARDLTQKTGKN